MFQDSTGRFSCTGSGRRGENQEQNKLFPSGDSDITCQEKPWKLYFFRQQETN
jgi:hypothetical protein